MLPQPSLSEYINGRYYQISIAFYYKFSLLCCFHIDPILLCRPFRYCERISWVIYPKSSLASGFPRKFLAKIKHSSGFHRKTEPRFSRVHVSFFFFFQEHPVMSLGLKENLYPVLTLTSSLQRSSNSASHSS